MLRPEGKFVFTFYKLHKSWKYGKAPPSLEFCEYTGGWDLCVVTTSDEYIKRTYQRHTEKRRSQLLLSFIQPYVEVSSLAFSRSIKEALKLAGIDLSIFKGHSTREVSSSKASEPGLSLPDILARGSWSSRRIRQRFIISKLWIRMVHTRKPFLVNMNLRLKQKMEDWAPVW